MIPHTFSTLLAHREMSAILMVSQYGVSQNRGFSVLVALHITSFGRKNRSRSLKMEILGGLDLGGFRF